MRASLWLGSWVVCSWCVGCGPGTLGDGPPLDGGLATDDAALADGGRVDAGISDDGSVGGDGGADAAVPLSDVHFVGRFDTSTGEDTPRFAWPGSEIVARVSGTTVSVDLESTGSTYFEAWIDGVRGEAFRVDAGTRSYLLGEALAPGEHVVRLIRRNESFVGGPTRFLGLVGADIVPSPAPYDRLIEYVGDSITCGYGNLGAGPGCDFTAETESEPDAHGAIAARALGVGHVAIAYSGIGLTQNYGGGTSGLMGERYEQTLAELPGAWDFSYTPDVVVIMLGTNDFWDGDPGPAFADAMDAFVQQVRGHHPDALVLLATSPMLGGTHHTIHRGHLDDAIGRALARGDASVSRVDVPTQVATDGIGCDYHPSVTTQERTAALIAAAIRSETGWP